MESSSRESPFPRALAAAVGGIVLGVLLSVTSQVDNRLVNAYRAGRALPYRAVFFGFLLVATILAWRKWTAGGMVVRALASGAVFGYLSGFLTWWVMQTAFVSAASALSAIREFPGGLVAPLTVPLLTFSWAFGAVVFGGAHLLVRPRRASQ